jgi:hypothetical protein
VLSSDEEVDGLLAVLRGAFGEVWHSKDGTTWFEAAISDDSRPEQAFDALFLHWGDLHLRKMAVEVEAAAKFRYNTVGGFRRRNRDFIEIYKPIGLKVKFTESDAREIAAYATGVQSSLPSCCTPPFHDVRLDALALLCQGYLVAHAIANRFDGTASLDTGAINDGTHADLGWEALEQDDVIQRLLSILGVNTREAAALLRERARLPRYWEAIRQARDPMSSWSIKPENSRDRERVKELICAIGDSSAKVTLTMVAEAYRALSIHLAER